MPNLCQVIFNDDPSSPRYSYYCNGLDPQPGQWVIVPVGKVQSLRIVKCMEVSDEPWRGSFPLKEIWGLVTTRPEGSAKPLGE